MKRDDPRVELEKLWGKALFRDGGPGDEIVSLYVTFKQKEQKEIELLRAMYGDGGFHDDYDGNE